MSCSFSNGHGDLVTAISPFWSSNCFKVLGLGFRVKPGICLLVVFFLFVCDLNQMDPWAGGAGEGSHGGGTQNPQEHHRHHGEQDAATGS